MGEGTEQPQRRNAGAPVEIDDLRNFVRWGIRDSRKARRASIAVIVDRFGWPDSASTIRRAHASSLIEFVGFTILGKYRFLARSLRLKLFATLHDTNEISSSQASKNLHRET